MLVISFVHFIHEVSVNLVVWFIARLDLLGEKQFLWTALLGWSVTHRFVQLSMEGCKRCATPFARLKRAAHALWDKRKEKRAKEKERADEVERSRA